MKSLYRVGDHIRSIRSQRIGKVYAIENVSLWGMGYNRDTIARFEDERGARWVNYQQRLLPYK